jgi:hypothetical protein
MTESNSGSDRPQFVVQDCFIETPFERRYQSIIRHAWYQRSWHIIAALPGSGKTYGIYDLLNSYPMYKDLTGKTSLPLLYICTPANAPKQGDLGGAISDVLGYVPPMRWNVKRRWLIGALADMQVECMIFDDAHNLSLEQLTYVKELTDNLAAPPYRRKVGLCLVVAHSGNDMPLKAVFEGAGVFGQQLRWRMDTERWYSVVPGHTEEEIRDILTAFEDLYRSQLPGLQLRRWSKNIFVWLTHKTIDTENTGRVTMCHLTDLVNIAVRTAYNQGATDVDEEIMLKTAELMTVRRSEITYIDDDLLSKP